MFFLFRALKYVVSNCDKFTGQSLQAKSLNHIYDSQV